MANQYFIFRKLSNLGEIFKIDQEEAVHHIFKVLRTQKGAQLKLVFEGGEVGLVEVINPETREVRLLDLLTPDSELPIEITVAVGFPKGDKLDFIVEKVTELGAHAVWASPFQWSVTKWSPIKLVKKQEKLSKIAQGAAEQSGRTKIPEIQLFDHQSSLMGRFADFDEVLVAYEGSAKSGERADFFRAITRRLDARKILLIFGPEGGIAPEEIKAFTHLGAKMIGLGPRILRAETAPLASLAMIGGWLELSEWERGK